MTDSPPTQTIRPSGFGADMFGEAGLPQEVSELIALLNSPAGRRALTIAMLAAETPHECFGRVLVFCKAKTKNELLQGEPFMWLKRLLARAANVRTT